MNPHTMAEELAGWERVAEALREAADLPIPSYPKDPPPEKEKK